MWIRVRFGGILTTVQHLALVVAALTALGAQAETKPDAAHAVRLAENAFQFRDFATVVATLDPWLHPPKILERDLLVTARRLMGVALAGLEREEEAKEEFGQLLLLDPTHELDPFVVPPNIIAVFQGVREEMKETLDKLTGKTQPDPVEPAPKEVVRVEIVTLPPAWMMVLPGGMPQFTLEQIGWGTLWLSVQVIGIVMNVLAWRALDPGGTPTEGGRFASLTALQYSGLVIFGGGWAASIVQGFSHYADVEAELLRPPVPTTTPAVGGQMSFSF